MVSEHVVFGLSLAVHGSVLDMSICCRKGRGAPSPSQPLAQMTTTHCAGYASTKLHKGAAGRQGRSGMTCSQALST